MNMRKRTIAAVVLSLSMLAGCAPQEPLVEPETTVPPETVTVIRETTAPTQAPVETEAPSTEATVPFEVTTIPVITTQQNSVTVTTADEFLAAIAPDTEIIVDAELIDWSKAAGYGEATGEYYYWEDPFDGPQLVITGVSNLTVRGAGEDHTAHVLSAVPRYAYVLTFENCANIHVKGLTAGHTEEPGYCCGGVLAFRNSQDILVEDCGLFGCGTIGVMGNSCKNMQIVGNDIYDCSVGGVEFMNCDMVNVDGNTFRDLGGPIFRIYDCGTITCNGEDAVPFQ